MSLVGPRPLFSHYLDHYTEEEHRRHEMRPGITGWAVVNGRNTLQFKERVRLDLWYLDHWSIWLDIKIMFRTLAQVINRTDVAIVEDDLALGFPMAGQVVDPVQPEDESRAAPGPAGTVETGARPPGTRPD